MTAFHGKSIFIWNVPAILGGDPVKIALWLLEHGFTSVMVKAADGPYVFYPSWSAFPNWLTSMLKLGRPNVDRDFVQALHAYGIDVIGWGFNYGRKGDGEGRIAAQQCDALGLDGWIFDVEGEFENRKTAIGDAGKVVGTFNKTIISKVPTCYCGWAEYWSPTGSRWHNAELAQFFMSFCDVGMIMLYWGTKGANGKPVVTPPAKVESMLINSLKQWNKITSKPVIPAGRAYTGDGGIASPESILAFGALARQVLQGVSYWVLDHAIKMLAISDALDQTPGWGEPLPPPPDPTPVPLPTPPTDPLGLYYVIAEHRDNSNGPALSTCSRNTKMFDNASHIPVSSWKPYLLEINKYDKSGKEKTRVEWIADPAGGPTKGIDGEGRYKWIGLAYPGNVLMVKAIIIGQDGRKWAAIQSVNNAAPPDPKEINYLRTPHLVHQCYGWNPSNVVFPLTGQKGGCVVPVVGEDLWFIPMSALRLIKPLTNMNVRATPSMNAEIVGSHRKGEALNFKETTPRTSASGDLWGRTPDGWVAIKVSGHNYTDWTV